MSEDKNKATVRIYGSEYKIASTDSEEHIQKVAYQVDKLMSMLAERDKRLSTALIAVLTAVNVMDDFLKLEERAKLLEKENAAVIKAGEGLRAERDELKGTNKALVSQIQNLRVDIAKLETQLRGKR